MKIVFMGTPDFSVPCLKALINSDDEVAAVFTQPDKPKGRGYKLTPPPVKEVALQYNIPVYQPISLKKGDDAEIAIKTLLDIAPDLIIVVAYGKILPKAILDIPKYCINVHASLLPKYRGAGPIQWSIINGEKYTGITTMLMEEGLDTGDIILMDKTEIKKDETYSELHDRLSVIGADTLMHTIKAVKDNTFTHTMQDDSESSYAPMISKEMCKIDFTCSAKAVHDKICGLSSFPAAFTTIHDKKLKVYSCTIIDSEYSNIDSGIIVKADDFTIMCGDGKCISLTDVQLEGKKRMLTKDFLRGYKIEKGEKLV